MFFYTEHFKPGTFDINVIFREFALQVVGGRLFIQFYMTMIGKVLMLSQDRLLLMCPLELEEMQLCKQ